MKKLAIISCLALCSISANAQKLSLDSFKNFDVSLSAGTTGIGVDVSAQYGDYLRARMGCTFMPKFHYTTAFGMDMEDNSTDAISEDRFEKMSDMLEEMTGFRVDNSVDMRATPKINNFRFLIDVMPFRNKDFYVTAGFYAGPSTIAKAVNTTEEAPTLTAVCMFNNMYNKIEKYIYEGTYGTNSNGEEYTSLFMGVELAPNQYEDILERYGRVTIPLGYYTNPDGSPVMVPAIDKFGDPILDENGDQVMQRKQYRMFPDKNGMVKVDMLVNKFRPYIGAGYKHHLDNEKKWHISADAGLMLWGSPKLVTHEGVDLIHDVKGVSGKVGDYVDLARAMNVFPVLNVNLSYRLF